MIARPLDRGLGHFVEITRRFDERRLFVVIAFNDWAIHFPHALHAFVRVGVVADDVTEANEVGASLFAGVGQHRVERFEIGMNVTENREAHVKVRDGSS